MVETISSALSALPQELVVFIVAMLPVLELRGALPLALTVYDMPLGAALFWALIGNLVTIPPLYFFLRHGTRIMRSASPAFDKAFTWYVERTRVKFHAHYERWGPLALIAFVAIPLPGTGTWSGTVAAWFFGMRLTRILFGATIGMIIAAFFILVVLYGIEAAIQFIV
jgi:uncharacterized membrane protein